MIEEWRHQVPMQKQLIKGSKHGHRQIDDRYVSCHQVGCCDTLFADESKARAAVPGVTAMRTAAWSAAVAGWFLVTLGIWLSSEESAAVIWSLSSGLALLVVAFFAASADDQGQSRFSQPLPPVIVPMPPVIAPKDKGIPAAHA